MLFGGETITEALSRVGGTGGREHSFQGYRGTDGQILREQGNKGNIGEQGK